MSPPGHLAEPFTDRSVCNSLHATSGPTQRERTRTRESHCWRATPPDAGSAPPTRATPLLDARPARRSPGSRRPGSTSARWSTHARDVGGPAIRALTFHERAGLLKALAKHLWPRTRTSSTRSRSRTGATQRDSQVDIDGGFGTLFSYASKGTPRAAQRHRRPRRRGSSSSASGGTFVGQHVYTSRPGVAVQINAFNFPVWGMLEKLAPAFLAGLPSDREAGRARRRTSPSSSSAGSSSPGILPEGSLQLLCRQRRQACSTSSAVQDSVAFTGSAHTAGHAAQPPHGAARRRHARRRGRLAQLLDPRPRRHRRRPGVRPLRQGRRHRDDGQGRPEVHRHPPRDRARRRSPTTSSRRSPPGSRRSPSATPRDADVRMGALASLDQREEVAQGDPGRCAASAEIVYGDPDHVDVVDADAERGRLPVAGAAARPAPAPSSRTTSSRSARSAPCITYDSVDEAVELAARGKGSLVGSLVTHDPDVARTVVLGLAPWHGRILVLDRDDAAGVHRPRLAAADARARRPRPGRRRRGARRHPRRPAPHAAHRGPGLARHAHRDHRPLDDRLAAQRRRRAPVPQEPRRAADRRHHRLGAAHGHPRRTSTTSPSSPATRSTPTPTPRRPPPTRCSAASSPTATSSCRWPPACSSTPTRARCWPTSASTTCGSSPRSRPTTRSR